MPGLESRIEELISASVETVEPIGIAEVTGPGRPAQRSRFHPTTVRSARLLAVAAMSALIAVGVGVGFVIGTRPASSPNAATTAPRSVPFALVRSWSAVTPASQTFSNSFMTAVTTWKGNYVAMGNSGSNLASWTSQDGRSWTRHDIIPSGSSGSMVSNVSAIVGDSNGIVAVGSYGTSTAAWYSTDGITWTETSINTTFLNAVITFKGNFIAVGDGVWVSSDGQNWREVSKGIPELGGAGAGGARGIAVVGNDIYAVGEDPFGPTAVVWKSSDGITWTQLLTQPSFNHSEMWAVTAGGPGLVAVGEQENQAAVWTSTDGTSWSVTTLGPGFLRSVTSASGSLVAGGSITGTGGIPTAAVWASVDGIAWSSSNVPTSAANDSLINGTAATGSSYIAVGGDIPNTVSSVWRWASSASSA